ncbi:MAG: hypothetical protein RXR18_06655 [Nitrososphaeria archaeon]
MSDGVNCWVPTPVETVVGTVVTVAAAAPETERVGTTSWPTKLFVLVPQAGSTEPMMLAATEPRTGAPRTLAAKENQSLMPLSGILPSAADSMLL